MRVRDVTDVTRIDMQTSTVAWQLTSYASLLIVALVRPIVYRIIFLSSRKATLAHNSHDVYPSFLALTGFTMRSKDGIRCRLLKPTRNGTAKELLMGEWEVGLVLEADFSGAAVTCFSGDGVGIFDAS